MIRVAARAADSRPRLVRRILVMGACLVAAFAVWSVLVASAGRDPTRALRILGSAFTSPPRLVETALRATPIVLCASGVAFAAAVSLWNIGAQGQLLVGAAASTWVAFALAGEPAAIVIPAALAAAALAGALWAGLSGLLRATFDVSEVLSTLLANYVAADLVLYLVQGPWRDPDGFQYSAILPESSWLPVFPGTKLHLGVAVAILVPCLVHVAWRRTVWGYELRVAGDSWAAARYAGVPLSSRVVLVMAISGALAGLAGGIEVTGHAHRLQDQIAPGYGMIAILVAFLAGKSPLASLPVGYLFAGLLVAGGTIQVRLGLPEASIRVLLALLLVAVLAGEGLLSFRLEIRRPALRAPAPP